MWTKTRSLLPSLASTVKPHRRTPLHPRRHERVAEGFLLVLPAPTLWYGESSGGAMKDMLLSAAVACSAIPIAKKKTLRLFPAVTQVTRTGEKCSHERYEL